MKSYNKKHKLKCYGYDVTIYEIENGLQNIRVRRKKSDSQMTEEKMTSIFLYLIREGFITKDNGEHLMYLLGIHF